MKKTTGAKSRKAAKAREAKTATGERDGGGDMLAYDAEYEQTIRTAFEGGLERHARLVYDALDEGGKHAAAGLDDGSAYPPPFNLSFAAQLARERAERFARSVTRAQWEAASRDEFIKRIAKRETLTVETFDPVRKLSRMTNERGETIEVQAARPLTDRRDVRNDFDGVDRERRGGVYVFTRWRMPSVGVEDVEFYGWRELVEKSGMVLVGSGDGARYYLPRDAEAHAKREKERKARRGQFRQQSELQADARRMVADGDGRAAETFKEIMLRFDALHKDNEKLRQDFADVGDTMCEIVGKEHLPPEPSAVSDESREDLYARAKRITSKRGDLDKFMDAATWRYRGYTVREIYKDVDGLRKFINAERMRQQRNG